MVERDERSPVHWIDLRWRLVFLVVPLATVVVALVQRHAFTSPSWSLACAVVIAGAFVACTFDRIPRALLVAAVVGGVAGMLAYPVQVDVAPFVLVFLVAIVAGEGAFGLGAVLLSAGLLVGMDAAGLFGGAAAWVLAIGFGWAGGLATCAQFRLVAHLRASQDELVARAALEERQRIAREVHDVVAHSLAVTMLHLGAARLALDDDPEGARESLLEAERAGRESLDEIRRSVGLLSAGGTSTRPMPTACDVESLVRELQCAGLRVKLRVEGDARAVPADVGLALYRVAQESLANAAKHAPGAPVDIGLHVDAAGTQLRVCNPRRPTLATEPFKGGGAGIPGMQERAASVGGTLRCGPAHGGWSVELVVPAPPS